MTPPVKSAQPTLAELTARFVARSVDADAGTAVTPHEMPTSFTVEPRTAWNEATATQTMLGGSEKPGKMPADWSAFVRQSAGADYLPMAIGHFPQQVRDVSLLLRKRMIPSHSEPIGWTAKEPLVAAAAARVARRFDEAERLLNETEGVPDALLANERAALLFARGDREQARAIWAALPATGPVCFNRGVAALAAGDATDTAHSFAEAAKLLPDTSGWHHLANLYRALAR